MIFDAFMFEFLTNILKGVFYFENCPATFKNNFL
jgi:hypothetical protein